MKKLLAVFALIVGVSGIANASSRDDLFDQDRRDLINDLRDQRNDFRRDERDRGGQNGSFNEEGYLRCNADVRRAVRNGSYRSGRDHYNQWGYRENRIIDGRCEASDAPRWFNDRCYLRNNPDVAQAVYRGDIRSGWHHYVIDGERERRNYSCQ
ncbi:MAG: hypothetical protein H7061_06490 [Bdellovibrionaceae bacterium]|nr:hypothetical protein [Bdellovibrio sp.]